MNEKNDLEEPLIPNNENPEKLNENIEYLPSEEIIENGNIKNRKNLNKTENMKDGNKKIERKPTMGDISLSSLLFRPIESGSLRSSVYGLICVTLGTGMLPLPYFFRTNGIILSLIIFFFCSFPTYITLKILTSMSFQFEIYSYN